MKYRQFHNALFRGLYDLAEEEGPAFVRFEHVLAAAGLPVNANWIARFAEEADETSFAEVGKHMGNPEAWRVRIKAAGSAHVEYETERDPSWGIVPREAAADALRTADSAPSDPSPAAQSSSWTGRPSLPEENRSSLIAALRSAERSLDGMEIGNSDKAQARAFVIAAINLAEAPNPPDDLIWEMVSRANQISGIAALFVSVLALFVT